MPSLMDVILRRDTEEKTPPECPDHHVEMRLRGKVGRPSRFEGTSEQRYTAIYFCPVPGCSNTAERKVVRRQVPVPGVPPRRPDFSRVERVETRRIEDRQLQAGDDTERAIGPGR